jgi:hypothetical protein
MSDFQEARRQFLKASGLAAGAIFLSPNESLAHMAISKPQVQSTAEQSESSAAENLRGDLPRLGWPGTTLTYTRRC